MLKGHVFYKQIFGNPIFALFINTFLNGRNGVSDNYKNGMSLSYSGSTVTVNSGAVCIQGRFLEEDTSTPISVGTDSAYCKLVIEIDLDKENTETEFNQASYKVVKSTSNYPSLTQTNIVKNNSGVYQYELARFRTGTNGITNFEDKRTFLDFDSIYDAMETEYEAVLQDLKDELTAIQNQSDVFLKSVGGTVEGEIIANGGISGQLIPKLLTNENLNNIKTEGFYYSYGGNTVQNKPSGMNNFSLLVIKTGENTTVQAIYDSFGNMYTRPFTNNQWYSWRAYSNSDSTLRVILSGAVSGSANFASNGVVTVTTKQTNIAVLTGTIQMPEAGSEYENGTASINYPNGYNYNNCCVLSIMGHNQVRPNEWNTPGQVSSLSEFEGNGNLKVSLGTDNIVISADKMATGFERRDITFKLVLMKVS